MMKVEVEVSPEQVWEAVFGNDGNGFAYWCGALRDVNHESLHVWKDTSGSVSEWVPNPQDFSLYDFEEDNWYTVTLESLMRAYVEALRDYPHLFADPDAETEDAIMQLAVFGELVYG